MLCRWEALPDFMQTKEVWSYYIVLRKQRFSLFIKRIFDFVMSSAMLVLLVPLFIFLAVWIKVDSEGPIFYRQKRVTQYGRIFEIYKFRTMVQNADKLGNLVTTKEDARITLAGKYLRGFRLDEIPQLINIWKGEMTFVGTRPEVVKYVKHYTKEMYATLLLPAGVTSMASIKFKDEAKLLACVEAKTVDLIYIKDVLPKKMQWNLEGLRNFSFFTECKILLGTIEAVIKYN